MDIKESIKKKLGFDIQGKDIKTEIQESVVQMADSFIILNWATRCGKSAPALKICSKGKSICFTPQTLLHDTLKQEAVDRGIKINSLEFACYASSEKYINSQYDTLWLDEGHSITERNVEHFASMKAKRIIVTSGTIPDDKMKLLYTLGKPKILRISIQDGIQWGLISTPKIFVIDRPLNALNIHTYIRGKNKAKKTIECTYAEWMTIYKWMQGTKRPNCHIKCNEIEYYNLLNEEFETLKWAFKQRGSNKQIIEIRRKLLGSKRKKWLNSIKTDYAKKLCDKLQGKRFIVFANDIEQCSEIARGKTEIHSKNSNKDDAKAIEDFNSGVINELYCVNKVDAGITLYDFDAAIHVSLSGSEIQPLQRQGRSLASDFPLIYIIRIPKTRDDDFFQDFKKNLDESWFKPLKLI